MPQSYALPLRQLDCLDDSFAKDKKGNLHPFYFKRQRAGTGPRTANAGRRTIVFIEVSNAKHRGPKIKELKMYALISGYLFRDPELKTSKSGAPYAKATIKEGNGDETVFASTSRVCRARCCSLFPLCTSALACCIKR
jgi:hypothetical protein